MKISYTKLRDGDWGLRIIDGSVIAGETVTVTKKNGDTKTETVGKVLWTGPDKYSDGTVTLATIRKNGSGYSRSYGGYSNNTGFEEYCGGRCPVGGFICSPRNGPCHDCV